MKMNRVEELIEWHEAVWKSGEDTWLDDIDIHSRDTATALTLLKELADAEDAYDKWKSTPETIDPSEDETAAIERIGTLQDELRSRIATALAAYRKWLKGTG